MKKRFAVLLLAISAATILLSCGQQKVLLIARRGGESLDSFLTVEIPMMTKMLKESGYSYLVASDSMEPIKAYSSSLTVDVLTSEARMQDYKGVLIACLGSKQAPEPAVAIVKKALHMSKAIASADGGLIVLSKAGVLANRRYAATKTDIWEFDKNGIFSGEGVIQDGLVITAGTCCLDSGKQDGTAELMRMFINSLKGSR